jgi:A/G-specific adenine glycosylase
VTQADPSPGQLALLGWYDRHQRDLPWRRTRDPYHVLVSEIMLQQTQVDRVIPYFEAFTARFSGFEALAAAPRSEVIQLWAGLGYNRRAVHLHELARAVVERHGGQLPADREALLALPGIGPYTAGAILSIAFGQDEPALDTNVRRVIARFAFPEPPSEREIAEAARMHVPAGRAADWNQALMDLGSSICTARQPRCLLCPIQASCLGRTRTGGPITIPKRPPPRFEGSTRYLRGRLLAELRDLPAGEVAPLHVVAARLARQGVAEPPMGWQTVGEDLARDGLARVAEGDGEIALGLA